MARLIMSATTTNKLRTHFLRLTFPFLSYKRTRDRATTDRKTEKYTMRSRVCIIAMISHI